MISTGNASPYVCPDCHSTSPIPELGGLTSCAGIPVDLSGNKIPGSPEFSLNLAASYSMQLGNAGSLSAGVQYYWQDEYYSRIFNGVTDTIEEWDVWNATLRFTPEQGNWYVELWGRNLGDDDFVTGQYRIDASSGLGTNQFLLDPRTYSVTLDYAF